MADKSTLMHVVPVVLTGGYVRLEPMAPDHAEGLLAAAGDASIWRYMPTAQPTTLADVQALIDQAAQEAARHRQLPFTIVARATDTVAGSTRLLDIQARHRTIEIGATWLGTAFQRTAINTECKYLLLRHCFETLGTVRVALKTDGRNKRSQQAIARLGALREGVLRKHMTMHDGYVRDSVYFSVIDDEWPTVKARLESMLAR